ncbi:gliding motility-associated C-terminal domain-containing protein [Cellulophaga baltica]|nr:gliding motility-associated C-terminal domain-containing protein [Cellulophaga baltica]MDO6769153.1 gliding motility-associated C-terminal domain-containing protein [Cellulophaga sp. 1_MG-2023]
MLIFTIYLLVTLVGKAQTFRNFGDIEIHSNGRIGFYSSLENDGSFENFGGLAGFYGGSLNSVSGTFSPKFYDLEIYNEEGVLLQIPMEVSNNTNFIFGDFITPKLMNTTSLEFISDSFYNGESNFSKVNGYISITNKQSFLFPIGDESYLRPLKIDTKKRTSFFKTAFFYENGNLNFSDSLDSESELLLISNAEYWILEGNATTLITIGWDDRSYLEELTNDENNITVVGFKKDTNQWVDLGATERIGNIEEGFITSELFFPDKYSAITFGILETTKPVTNKGYHYIVTPNGDGINDFLLIPELEDYDSNRLLIFDRNGLKVFEQENYYDEFNGKVSIPISALNRDKGLPEGVYFYLVYAGEENFRIQGFLYLKR